MQPKPADVTACLYTWSETSPAAKTPSIDVAVAEPFVARLAAHTLSLWRIGQNETLIITDF